MVVMVLWFGGGVECSLLQHKHKKRNTLKAAFVFDKILFKECLQKKIDNG